jgi:hypothetical protein
MIEFQQLIKYKQMKTLRLHWVENTFVFINKKQVSQSIEKNAVLYFIEDINEIDNGQKAYIVRINDTVFTKEDLLNEYNTKFRFPYFGFNWDAFLDCLRDLSWIKQENIIICHHSVPKLNAHDLKIYLDILRFAVADWERYKEHNLNVCFNLENYYTVKPLYGSGLTQA